MSMTTSDFMRSTFALCLILGASREVVMLSSDYEASFDRGALRFVGSWGLLLLTWSCIISATGHDAHDGVEPMESFVIGAKVAFCSIASVVSVFVMMCAFA